MKKNVAIEAGIGAGPIVLGCHRDHIQRAYTYIYSSFFKTRASKFRSDHCEIAGFIAHYDLNGLVEYIEIFTKKEQIIEYELFGASTTNMKLSELKSLLASEGIHFTQNEYGIDASSIGLSTFNHDLSSDEETIECFGIFRAKTNA